VDCILALVFTLESGVRSVFPLWVTVRVSVIGVRVGVRCLGSDDSFPLDDTPIGSVRKTLLLLIRVGATANEESTRTSGRPHNPGMG